MSEETKEVEQEPVKKEPKKQKKKETEYGISELRKHSQELYGVKREVFDGAFSSYEEETVTKSQAEKRIKAFLNKEVIKR